MNEKKRMVTLAIVMVLIAFGVTTYIYALSYTGGAQNITSTITTSRYIMFGGAYNVEGTDRVDNGVFKLDTYNGDTWMLSSHLDANGNQSKNWLPVDSRKKNAGNQNVADDTRIKELYAK